VTWDQIHELVKLGAIAVGAVLGWWRGHHQGKKHAERDRQELAQRVRDLSLNIRGSRGQV
jgi:hypothetical protein